MKTNMLDKDPLTPGTCEWCGNDCELDDAACSLSCEAQLNRLEATQGRMVLRTLKRWRKHSGRKGTPGEGAFSEITSMIDLFLRTDRQRREKLQAEKRSADAGKPAAKIRARSTPAQTAAPVVDQPEEHPDDL